MRVYLDVCCLCRPFDDFPSNKISIESDAILTILKQCQTQWELIDSEVIHHEISKIPDDEKRLHVMRFLENSKHYVTLNQNTIDRAKELWIQGIDTYDALHIVCAYESNAIFLTVDEVLIKKINKVHQNYMYNIINPVIWLMEMDDDSGSNNK